MFMKKLLAILPAAVMLLSLTAAAGAEGKVLRFGQMDAKVGYDPQTNTNSGATTTEDCVVEPLYYWNDQNELIPLLAEDFPEISDDGLVYTFKLRQGVKFSDGTDLTTDDVKFTFERMFKPETLAKSTAMYNMILGAKEMLKGDAAELAGFEAVDLFGHLPARGLRGRRQRLGRQDLDRHRSLHPQELRRHRQRAGQEHQLLGRRPAL